MRNPASSALAVLDVKVTRRGLRVRLEFGAGCHVTGFYALSNGVKSRFNSKCLRAGILSAIAGNAS